MTAVRLLKERPHLYQTCRDEDCPRQYCRAYKDGYEAGFEEGYAVGFGAGYAAGCPEPRRSA